MKRNRFLISSFTAVALAFSACEKAPDTTSTPPSTQPAQPGTPVAPSSAPKAADTTKPVAAASQPVAAPAADISKLSAQYGFPAKLPKDVEAFSTAYRAHDLWLALANSKWTATLLSIPQIKDSPEFARVREQWSSPPVEKAKEIAEAVLGQEYTFALPAGFTAKLGPWMEFFGIYNSTVMEATFMSLMSGGGAVRPDQMQAMIKDAAPKFIPSLSKCEVPPMLFSFKATKVRPVIDDATKQLMGMVGANLPPAIEAAQFKLADKYDFTSISVSASKLIAQFQTVQLELQLKELLGDEKQAKEAMDAIVNKRIEIAWGWVDDYLIVSVGADHAHLKFAAGEADSILANPIVASRAAQFADKKPIGLSYASKGIFEALVGKVEFANEFKAMAEELAGILKPEHIEAMVADVRKLETKAQALFTRTFDAQVSVDYYDAGFRSESFGGEKDTTHDSSKPLAFANLASASTFLLLDSRTNAASSKATLDFMEEGAATVWGWFDKYGRTMVPESERQGFAAIEALALPLLKDFWDYCRNLGKALGDESAFVFDTNGTVPSIPDAPPFIAEGKMPRIAFIAELKDRAALGESWKGFSSIIKQLAALAGQEMPPTDVKPEGAVEIHSVPIPLPFPTGDFVPHIGISKDRWIISTSPSLTKDLASKSANTTGQALGGQWTVNFLALYDLAEAWVKVVDKHATEIMGAGANQYQAVRPVIDTALKLARSIQGFEVKSFQENGQSRDSIHLKLQDVK